jgi:putative protease
MIEHVPEILAPAGTFESFRAALASGADVVYLGLSEGFNARARSTAFDRAGLPELVDSAHRAGVKLYLTVNTLVFERELPSVAGLIADVARAGVDALIVQDPAVALLARRICPELRVHASTQMTISSAEGARFAATLGVSRVVLPRELSTREIARFTAESPMPSEVFVHGALCMAWSGQCLTSEALSNRSANRGQCSQACRMPYDLIVDGERRDLGDVRYLLSPQDLAAHDALPELAAAGVHGFKIEGRYKNAAYVTTTVDAVRELRDALARGQSAPDRIQLRANLRRTQLTFSRGASPGFLDGDDHQALVVGTSPKHRGLALGRVTSVRGQRVRIALDGEHRGEEARAELRSLLRAGMGVLFELGDPEADDAPGGPIFALRWLDEREPNSAELELSFGTPGPDLTRVPVGTAVRLTGDPELVREAQRRVQSEVSGRIALTLTVHGRAGEPLHVHARARFAERDLLASAATRSPLAPARAGGLDAALLTDKLGGLGGTPFALAQLDLDGLDGGLHVAVSELKQLRRELVAALEAALLVTPRAVHEPEQALAALRNELGCVPTAPASVSSDAAPQLVVLCRTLEQLEAVIASEPRAVHGALGALGSEVELDFMELVGLGDAVRVARAAGLRVTLATVRVQKPGEESYDRRIAALEPDAVLVRHWGALMHFAEPVVAARGLAVHGDFSLNVTNSITARHLLALGLRTVTASHDLDRAQLLELLAGVPAGRVALTVHHHIPTFHNSHCVYAHLLSDGKDYRSCGRPCEQHRIALRDFAGHDHPVIVDVSCRNTVFNAVAQSAAPLVPELIALGVRRFRVEFVWEQADEVSKTLRAYRQLLAGRSTPTAVLRAVGVHEQYGVTALRR